MQIERIAISELSGDPANARKHGEQNLATIVASLRRFGQQKPIVVDLSNVVRAGNGTLEAARSLGWTHLACVRTELQSSDAIAYAIADNRTAELAEWDDEVLAAMLNGLAVDDPDLLAAAGFSDADLENLLAEVVDDPEDEWQGMPEMENDAVKEVNLIVYFASVDAKIAFAKQVKQMVSKDTKFVWFPKDAKPVRQGVGVMVAEET